MNRFHENHLPYFITTVTNERKSVFKDKKACDLFIHILIYHKFLFNFKIYGYAIMPDHVHVVMDLEGDGNISEIIKKIKGNFARFYNKMNNNQGTIWQKSFYESGIRNRKSLVETLVYIHNNPIRRGLVEEIGRYQYSSWKYYHGGDDRFQLLLDKFE